MTNYLQQISLTIIANIRNILLSIVQYLFFILLFENIQAQSHEPEWKTSILD